MRATMMLPITLMALIGCRADVEPGEEPLRLNDSGDLADEMPTVDFFLSTDTIMPGEVIITALTADDPAFDYAMIEEVILYGDVQLCASQTRTDELLLSIGAEDFAEPQSVDMILLLQDGDSIYLPDALQVAL